MRNKKILLILSLALLGGVSTHVAMNNGMAMRAEALNNVETVSFDVNAKTTTGVGDVNTTFSWYNKKSLSGNYTLTSIIDGGTITPNYGAKFDSKGTLDFTTSYPWSAKILAVATGSGSNKKNGLSSSNGTVIGNSDSITAAKGDTFIFEITDGQIGDVHITRYGNIEITLVEMVITYQMAKQTTFDANTGSFANNQLTYECTQVADEAVTAPSENPSKEGYTFKGWSATQNGTEAVTTYAWNTTYYAIWNINSYLVSFMSGTDLVDTQSVNHGEKATVTDKVPTKEGNYEFAGWDYDFNQPITGETTINAIWKEYFYIEVNGAQEVIYVENPTYTLPELDSEGANLFKGWTTVQGGTEVLYNAGQVVDVTAGSKFYPVYENVGTITVNFMDGTSVLSSQEITKNTPVDVPASDPTKEGYRFDGWKKEDGSNFDFTVDLAENTNVYASWNKQVTVTFEGATVVDNNVYYETDKVAKPADPTKENYVFDGWYNGNELYDFNSELKGDITLTAHWKNYVYTQIAVNGVKDSTVITPVSDELSFYKTVEQETNSHKNVSKVTTENGVWTIPYTADVSDAFVVTGTLSGDAYNPTGSVVNKVLKCECSADEYNYKPNTQVNTIKAGSTLDFYLTNRKGAGTSSASFKIEFMNNGVATTLNETYTLSNTSDFHVNKCSTVIANDITFDSVKITHTSGKVCLQAITFGYDKEEGGLDLSASKYSLRFTEEVEASVLEGKESVELSSYYKIDDGAFTKVETSTINVSSLKVLENGRYELSLLIYNLPVEVLNHSITVYFEVDGVKSAERTVTIKELAQVYKNDHSGQLTEFELTLLDELLK